MNDSEPLAQKAGCGSRLLRLFGILSLLAFGAVVMSYALYGYGRVQYAKAKVGTQAVLDAQVSAWNAGDLDGFMAGYWNSEELKFLSGDIGRNLELISATAN